MKYDAKLLVSNGRDPWCLRSIEELEGGPASEWHLGEEDDFLSMSLGLPVFQCPEYREREGAEPKRSPRPKRKEPSL